MRVMRHTGILLFAIAAVIAPTGAAAQDRPVNFILGGGFTAPNSKVRDQVGDGYNVVIGLQGNVTLVIGIEGLYSFNGLGQKSNLHSSERSPGRTPVPTDFFGDMNMQYGTGSLILIRGRALSIRRFNQ